MNAKRTRGATGLGALLCASALAACASARADLAIVGDREAFAPGIVSSEFSEIRLTLAPDGRTAMWFSRDRPGGAGGYDIWMAKKDGTHWGAPRPAPFNSPQRDFDPAFSADGAFVYFSSDRPGGEGGDDLYRVAVTADGFGGVEHLSSAVNSAGNEWGAMLAPDGRTLVFASNGRGGAGRFDLFTAQLEERGFAVAAALPGDVNTSADEFDPTFLADGASIVFARAPDLRIDRVDLFFAERANGRYGAGVRLPLSANSTSEDTYGAMLDWSARDTLSFSGRRPDSGGVDVFRVRYRMLRVSERRASSHQTNDEIN